MIVKNAYKNMIYIRMHLLYLPFEILIQTLIQNFDNYFQIILTCKYFHHRRIKIIENIIKITNEKKFVEFMKICSEKKQKYFLRYFRHLPESSYDELLYHITANYHLKYYHQCFTNFNKKNLILQLYQEAYDIYADIPQKSLKKRAKTMKNREEKDKKKDSRKKLLCIFRQITLLIKYSTDDDVKNDEIKNHGITMFQHMGMTRDIDMILFKYQWNDRKGIRYR